MDPQLSEVPRHSGNLFVISYTSLSFFFVVVVRLFLFFAVNMHLSACWEGASFFVVFSFQVCLLVIIT